MKTPFSSPAALRVAGLIGAAILALTAGCSPPEARTSATTNDAPEWKWDFYPPTHRMKLAALPCQLMPKSSISIFSPLVGVLRVYVDEPQMKLDAEHLWAEFEPGIFAAEEQALEEARLKLEEKERIQLELELPKQKLRMEREMEEAKRQLALLNLLSTNRELASLALTVPGTKASLLKPDSLGKAEKEFGLLQQSFNYLESTNLMILGIDLPGQRSDWQRRKLEFDRRQAQSRLRMPFAGQLTVALPLTEGVRDYPVNAGQEIAVARDLTTIRLRVPMSNPAWANLSPSQLQAVVRLSAGEELRAAFAFQKIEKVQMREESVYYFEFPPEKASLAARLMGTDVSCELWLNLPQPARIVPKLTLVMQHPASFQGRGWAQGISMMWPGANVLVEGQTDVAITLPNVAMKKD